MVQKKPDPISDKARALNDEIAALEAEIKKLDSQLARTPSPKFRSTATPPGDDRGARRRESPRRRRPRPNRYLKTSNAARWRRRPRPRRRKSSMNSGCAATICPRCGTAFAIIFAAPTTNNPRLVNYLAAGGVQGLRPLRYEKRVARNRVVVLAVVFFLILLGILRALLETTPMKSQLVELPVPTRDGIFFAHYSETGLAGLDFPSSSAGAEVTRREGF